MRCGSASSYPSPVRWDWSGPRPSTPVNRGTNGLEMIAALVSQNVVGEAARYGFGSALAVIMMLISSVFITIYLRIVFEEERR